MRSRESNTTCCVREQVTEEKNDMDSVSTSPAYVKRTAQLFEDVTTFKSSQHNGYSQPKRAAGEIQLTRNDSSDLIDGNTDVTDADRYKKPSYLGVSCSNSGYRNAMNYDSKLREGFRTQRGQRESLVVSNSRLRESSPLRFDAGKTCSANHFYFEAATLSSTTGIPASGCSPETYSNISTSTITISTFRACSSEGKTESKSQTEEQLSPSFWESKQSSAITSARCEDMNGKKFVSENSDLGFTSKICDRSQRNCNSFVKSMDSFEKNVKGPDRGTKQNFPQDHVRVETDVSPSKSSIQQRIERLYGPSALAQGFYVQRPNARNRTKSKMIKESLPPGSGSNLPQNTETDSQNNTKLLSLNSEAKPVSTGDFPERHGYHFLKLLKNEVRQLDLLATSAEKELERGENLTEEASGKLRSAAGKARLLIRQKLNQFEGLCQKNLNEDPDDRFPTTNEDLAGFWDMVKLQIVQVYNIFDEIQLLKKNNWNVTETTAGRLGAIAIKDRVSRTSTGKIKSQKAIGNISNEKSDTKKKDREESRKVLLQERRRQMKELKENQFTNSDTEIKIYAKQ